MAPAAHARPRTPKARPRTRTPSSAAGQGSSAAGQGSSAAKQRSSAVNKGPQQLNNGPQQLNNGPQQLDKGPQQLNKGPQRPTHHLSSPAQDLSGPAQDLSSLHKTSSSPEKNRSGPGLRIRQSSVAPSRPPMTLLLDAGPRPDPRSQAGHSLARECTTHRALGDVRSPEPPQGESRHVEPPLQRPEASEYAPYFEKYVALVPAGDILVTLGSQLEEILARQWPHRGPGRQALCAGQMEHQGGARARPRCRAHLRLSGPPVRSQRSRAPARFDQNEYVSHACFAAGPLRELAAEFGTCGTPPSSSFGTSRTTRGSGTARPAATA